MSLLSHYTNRVGLEGIAASQTLWATSFLELDDPSEYFYAWSVLLKQAASAALQNVPEDLKRGDFELDFWLDKMLTNFREAAAKMDRQGHLFIFSFARGSSEDQDRRGILTLWKDYARYDGYCLQFENAAVDRLLQMEMMRGNYHWMQLCPVQYGIDSGASDFKELVEQLSKRIGHQLSRISGDERIIADYQGLWTDGAFVRRLIAYCGRHKDPSYVDQREVRIFGCPADSAESRSLIGIASKKQVRLNRAGKHYIDIGEYWRPGLQPSRIIVGPNADRDIDHILSKFEVPVEVILSDIPVRRS